MIVSSVTSLVSKAVYHNMIMIRKAKTKTEKKIVPIFLINGISSALIIPIRIARKYNINKPSHVTLEDTEKGILIKKLEFTS